MRTRPRWTYILGIASIIANCLVWYFGIRTGPDVPDSVFATTFLASFLLPVALGWQVNKWWILLSLSPMVLWALKINHVC